jgi:hypothetical protein
VLRSPAPDASHQACDRNESKSQYIGVGKGVREVFEQPACNDVELRLASGVH